MNYDGPFGGHPNLERNLVGPILRHEGCCGGERQSHLGSMLRMRMLSQVVMTELVLGAMERNGSLPAIEDG